LQKTSQKDELQNLLSEPRKQGHSIGFVPTMGALHEGHLSLVEKAFCESDMVVVSIFVNPTQFDKKADLEKYPRDLEKDLKLLEKKFPDVIVFSPSAKELYNGEVKRKHFDFGPISEEMEGKHRPGHFDGVGTVLELLFDIVKPDKAFFGEKDFQQLQIVKKLVEITGQTVKIIGCPISRETNGLAMSSRNELLTGNQREEAAFIHQTLQKAKKMFGTKNATFVADWARGEFKQNPHFELEYFEIADEETLKTIRKKETGRKYRAFVAAKLGNIRLIDNLAL
jgi:pantoate--beta-alanine ligase